MNQSLPCLLVILMVWICLSHAATTYICENKKSFISCADQPGKSIDVTFADYGRSSNEICDHPTSGSTCPMNTVALDKVRELCQGVFRCELHAASSVFGDSCPNVAKYLEVRFECVDTDTKYICEYTTGTLSCLDTPGAVLDISYANYGRDSDDICVDPVLYSVGPCPENPNALSIVQTECQDMSTCTLSSSNAVFTDTCPNVFKYLEIHCQCVCPTDRQPCPGPNEGCDQAGDCSCIDGFFRDINGDCVSECNPACGEGEICTRGGTCECGPTTVRDSSNNCVTCELDCDTAENCTNEGEICNSNHECVCPTMETLLGQCVKVCPTDMQPCPGPNKDCDPDGNCNCSDGYFRDLNGECVSECNPACGDGEICTRGGTCECGPTTVRDSSNICVTCELDCDTAENCTNEGEICNSNHECVCPTMEKLLGQCVKRGQLGGWCLSGKCFGKGVKCDRLTNMCVCYKPRCGPKAVCAKRKRYDGHTGEY